MSRVEHQLRSGKRLVVDSASTDDAHRILEFVEEVSGQTDFLSFGPGEFGLTAKQVREFIGESLAARNRVYFLGQVDGRIVSTTHFVGGPRPRNQHFGEFGITVHQNFWRQGIGSIMIDSLLEWARGTGIVTKVNLRVRVDNHSAIQLYERKGFVHEGTIRQDFQVDGQYFDNHCMGLKL